VADLDAVEAAVETWQTEAARLLGERRAVGLVEEPLRGKRSVARLRRVFRRAFGPATPGRSSVRMKKPPALVLSGVLHVD